MNVLGSTRSRGRIWMLSVAFGLALGCAVPPTPPAYLRVEVDRGRDLSAPLPGEGQLHVVLDLSTSVREMKPVENEPTWQAAARNAARAVLGNAPAGTQASLRVLGLASASPTSCTTPIPVGGSDGRAEDLDRLIPELGGASESSLAAALLQLYPEVPRPEPVGRVVIVSDFANDCESRTAACESAAQLIDAGAEIDLVAVGGDPIPACWAQLAPRTGAIDVAAGPAPRVRVEWREQRVRSSGLASASKASDRSAVVPPRGRVQVPAGAVRVIVDLDPPEIVGPLMLPAGVETRVRVLDFPSLSPPVREVFVDTVGSVVQAPVSTNPSE